MSHASPSLDGTPPLAGSVWPIALGVAVSALVSLLHFIGAVVLFATHPNQILDPSSFGHIYYPAWLTAIVLCGIGFALSGFLCWRRSVDYAIVTFLGCTLVSIVAPVAILYVLMLMSR
ncbi:hypothetical protein LF1_56340 [Rubripirellula obstinata]|uniref:Uncharacterized protein n=1 Tax=Rubripirellula obstinata TaxID=406547 RepID=A0A5B1C9X0_9BACT|nr:hypothetical protein [Rubripirellula obstinata]KAA1257072.1 hypothetical protein LF1_56340 [Rubripirellula obstinata]